MIDLAVLKTEIETDPAAVGYAPHVSSGNHSAIAALLREPSPGGETIDVPAVSAQRLHAQAEAAEYLALSQGQRDLWLALLTVSEDVPLGSSLIRGQIGAVWGPGSTTRTRIIALQDRPAARIEVLFGIGTKVRHSDVAAALKG